MNDIKTSRARSSNSNRPSRESRNHTNSYKSKTATTASAAVDPKFVVRAKNNSRPSKNDQRKKIQIMHSGNLASKYLNPNLFSGTKLKSNSPDVFPDGNYVKIIPLGGVSEVGMNMTAIESGDDIVVIDTGFAFGGGNRYPGIDYIIPDTAWLEQNRHRIRGLIYTHGHLDHIGGAPYILPKLGNIPIFGLPLTLTLLKNRLSEFEMDNKFVAKVIDMTKPLILGSITIEFFHLNHSIPDVVGLSINTQMGRIIYATDWKFDMMPYDGKVSDYGKLAKFGDEGVRLLLTDSLGVLKPGYAKSETEIAKTIADIIVRSPGRVILTTFSTTIPRMQHTINACERTGRKLILVGRSMVANFQACFELGYLKVPAGMIVDVDDAKNLRDDQICILATGSQGEDNAALYKMARDEHPKIKLQGGDSVIFSTSAIPGNEDDVAALTSALSRKGVDVYTNAEFSTHVSGHACQEDLKLLISLTRPQYLQPIHGEHFMLKKMSELGASMGILPDNCLISENGRVTVMKPLGVEVSEEIIGDNHVFVDGNGVGAVSEQVLQERRQMAAEGVVMLVILVNKSGKLVAPPEIISRGFVYIKTNNDLFDEIKRYIQREFPKVSADSGAKNGSYFSDVRNSVKQLTQEFILDKTKKHPMIIPTIVVV